MSELCDRNGLTEAEYLSGYDPGRWPRPSVTADHVILSREPGAGYSVLLIRRGGHPCIGQWALPGGFVEEQEPPWMAARRELWEETGLEDIPSTLIGVFGDPDRDPRGWTITCAYAALVNRNHVHPTAGDDAREAAWFRLDWVRTADTMTLYLSHEGTVLSAALAGLPDITPLGRETHWTILSSTGLAFDHAKIIAAAVEHLEPPKGD